MSCGGVRSYSTARAGAWHVTTSAHAHCWTAASRSDPRPSHASTRVPTGPTEMLGRSSPLRRELTRRWARWITCGRSVWTTCGTSRCGTVHGPTVALWMTAGRSPATRAVTCGRPRTAVGGEAGSRRSWLFNPTAAGRQHRAGSANADRPRRAHGSASCWLVASARGLTRRDNLDVDRGGHVGVQANLTPGACRAS